MPIPARRRPRSASIDPFFAGSGLAAFAGCTLLSWAAHQRPDELAPPAVALGVFTLYQALVLALALRLARRGRRAAARQLAVLLLLLLPDACLLVSELVTAAPRAGVLLAAAGLGWAVLGAAAAGRVLRLRWSGWTLAAGAAGLLVAFGAPLAARLSTDTGFLDGRTTYAAAWALGGLAFLGLGAATSRPRRVEQRSHVPTRPLRRTAHRAETLVVSVAVASGLLHLGVLAVMYEPRLGFHHLAPLLLGLSAVAAWRSGPLPFAGSVRPADRPGLRVTAAVAAAAGLGCAALGDARPLGDAAWLTPLALHLAALSAAWLFTGLVQARPWLVAAGSLPLLGGLAWALRGPAASAVEASRTAAGWTRSAAAALVPRGPLAWGGILLGVAFALLGLGAWRSRGNAEPRTAAETS